MWEKLGFKKYANGGGDFMPDVWICTKWGVHFCVSWASPEAWNFSIYAETDKGLELDGDVAYFTDGPCFQIDLPTKQGCFNYVKKTTGLKEI